MDRAMYAAASGMAAQQQNLDTIANNLANADVAGFKAATQRFTVLAAAGEPGAGTASIGSQLLFTQGKLAKSDGPFDVAIDGNGFFCVRGPHGEAGFTRDGQFARQSDGTLRNAAGWRLEGVVVPVDASKIEVAANGEVTVTRKGAATRVATLRIAQFAAPEELRPVAASIFTQSARSGKPQLIASGAPDGPQIKFGMLEQSNVSIIESMMQILAAQRAYEANAKGVQAADEMLRIANNLQHG